MFDKVGRRQLVPLSGPTGRKPDRLLLAEKRTSCGLVWSRTNPLRDLGERRLHGSRTVLQLILQFCSASSFSTAASVS